LDVTICLIQGVFLSKFLGPPYAYEQGFQGKIERFNGEIQRKFWRRKYFKNIRNVKEHLKEYVLEHRLRQQSNIVTAPPRRRVPKRWKYQETTKPKAMIIYLRRTDEHGFISFLENDFLVSQHWLNRLV
jgi:hypothetical protein